MEQQLHDLLEGLDAIVWEADAATLKYSFVNRRAEELLGYALARWLNDPEFWLSIIHPEDREQAASCRSRAIETGRDYQCEYRAIAADGRTVWLRSLVRLAKDTQGRPLRLRGLALDISAQKRAEEQTRLRERVLESSVNGIFIVDARKENFPIVYANPAFERITGLPAEETEGQQCFCMMPTVQDDPQIGEIHRALREHREGYAVISNYRKDGSKFWMELFLSPVQDRHGRITNYVGILNDVTERKDAEERLAHLASHDVLTGLPNRSLFHDRLKQAIAYTRRAGGLAAILFLDLDRFKIINDTLGHGAGDAVLRGVTERLRQCLREGDTVARLGGDEFALVSTGLARPEDAAAIAAKILDKLSAPIVFEGRELSVGGSIGISLYPRDCEDIKTLLEHADAAMYRAKEAGRNCFRFFAQER